jgi:hypothetical protein
VGKAKGIVNFLAASIDKTGCFRYTCGRGRWEVEHEARGEAYATIKSAA